MSDRCYNVVVTHDREEDQMSGRSERDKAPALECTEEFHAFDLDRNARHE